MSTFPAQGAVLDSPRIHVDFCLSARVDPGSVRSEDLRFRSGVVFYDSAVEVELLNWRERGGEAGGLQAWCEGSVIRISPRSQVAPGVTYRVTLYDGLQGWRGERFDLSAPGWLVPEPADTDGSDDPRFEDPRFTLSFSVAPEAETIDEPPAPAPTSLATLFEPGAVFDTEGTCNCHADPKYPATELLDLRDPERAYRSLVLDPRVSSTGARRVAPGAAQASYVVQKLARDDQGNALHAVTGLPMPPPQVDDMISHAHLVQLSEWIHLGAAP